MKDNKFLTLGIETSCDETAISVVADGRTVLSNIISSQIDNIIYCEILCIILFYYLKICYTYYKVGVYEIYII